MFAFLKNHPFAVEAFFESSLVLTFAVRKEDAARLHPSCFKTETFGAWAFIAVALVQTKNLRPKGFPEFFGNDFFLAGYRVFVDYETSAGKRLRGLYILGSETDKKKMERLGNMFTHYKYTTSDVRQTREGNRIVVSSAQTSFRIEAEIGDETTPLPAQSPFSTWKEARRFAGPLPFTFSWLPEKKKVLIVEGVRTNWQPRPVNVLQYSIPFLDQLQLPEIKLANAFIIHDIPYYWKKGKTDPWEPKENRSRA